MKKVPLETLLKERAYFKKEVFDKKVFVYPTDTIYGIGGLFPVTLPQIYDIKKRSSKKPVSVIIPNLSYLTKMPIDFSRLDNIDTYRQLVSMLSNLLSIYWEKQKGVTFVLPLKRPLRDIEFEDAYHLKLGIRILNHPIQEFFEYVGDMFITTSANLSGEEVIEAIDQLPLTIKQGADRGVDGGLLKNTPSLILDAQAGFLPISRK